MRRATLCASRMYSLMSMRIIARVVVEEHLGERLGELGLADAGGAEEEEGPDRSRLVLQAGAGAAHGCRATA